MHLEEPILETLFSSINSKRYRKSWKEFDVLKKLINSNIVQIIMIFVDTKYGVKRGISLRF